MEQKKSLTDTIFSNENEKKLEQMQVTLWQLFFKILGLFSRFFKIAIPLLISYAIVSWIYLTILDYRGFETAVILALVAIIVVTARKK